MITLNVPRRQSAAGVQHSTKNEYQCRAGQGRDLAANQITRWTQKGRSQVIDTVEPALKLTRHLLLVTDSQVNSIRCSFQVVTRIPPTRTSASTTKLVAPLISTGVLFARAEVVRLALSMPST
jgi:hypothetical protein